MPDDSFRTIRALLSSTKPEEIRKGLDLAAIEITKLGASESAPLFEMITTLFYIDVLDRPELAPVVDYAINLAVGFGPWILPILIERLDAGDIKAQWAVAHVLGRIGPTSIAPMMKAYEATDDPTLRAFIMYALGKIKSHEIAKAIEMACDAARSSHLELRDTATRALGKFAESIPAGTLRDEAKQMMIKCLHDNLSDANASVRAKAIRSLGKLAKFRHMTKSERNRLRSSCESILGSDEKGEWDRAFIVRKEAEEAISHTD